MRTLDEGDHFGEIALIYNCDRTATVTSMNYNTFATMSSIGYKRLIQDYPEYEVCLKRNLAANYRDHRTQSLKKMFKLVEYLDMAPTDIILELIWRC